MTIPHALLALLTSEPKFGLRLKEEFEMRTGSVWPLNVGQVYTTLQRLERDGHVTTANRESGESEFPSQKLYTLTPLGRTELTMWFHTPPNDTSPPRDEVVIKVMVALCVPSIDVFEIVQTHRRRTLENMQIFARMKRESDADLALSLVADAELFRLEATVRWLDSCDARLRRGDQLGEPANPRMTQRQARSTQPSPGGKRSTRAGTRA